MTDTAIAVILAGGKGTRSADPTTAKLAQTLGGRTLLDWHLQLLHGSAIADVVIVAGHLGDQIDAIAQTVTVARPRLRILHEEKQQGTVAALRLAAGHTDADRFLVILGDILMSLDIDAFLQAWRSSERNVAVVVHPSTHPEDSDAAVPLEDGSVIVRSKRESKAGLPNSSSAGLFAITREGLRRYGGQRDVGSDVLPAAAASHDLFAYVSSHYLKDTGTPDRLEAARADIETGVFDRRGDTRPRPALFLDRDGVVNPAEPEFYMPDEYVLNPGVAHCISRANRLGIPVVIVTNQPGIAKGFMTIERHRGIRARMDALLAAEGAFVDDYAYCPHHPESGFEGEVAELKVPCSCRKPEPGLLTGMAARHGLDLPDSVMVGDTDRDQGAAAAAGVRFIRVDPDAGVGPCEAIDRAIEVLTC